jgi:hypothetical protein
MSQRSPYQSPLTLLLALALSAACATARDRSHRRRAVHGWITRVGR